MDSKVCALNCKDILRIILEKVSVTDLARAACVCKLWYSLASDGEIQVSAFKAPWKLKDVVGIPSSGSFWRDNNNDSLAKFAISHRIGSGDSVASLAVKYSVQVMEIKRLNNMISDHGIYSRDRLLIPVKDPQLLVGKTCRIELDRCAKREVAVIYLDEADDEHQHHLGIGGGVTKNASNNSSRNSNRRRVIESLRRSMQVDDDTAQYYLSISNGDPRAAISHFSQDINWETGSASH